MNALGSCAEKPPMPSGGFGPRCATGAWRATACRRQYPIGRYIADFACTRHRLIVEADGGQHDGSDSDVRRTAWLEDQGWRVLRFWNNDVLTNTEGVVETILKELSEATPHPPSPSGWPPPSPGTAGEGLNEQLRGAV